MEYKDLSAGETVFGCSAIVIGFIIGFLLRCLFVMYLWNFLLPVLFAFPVITYLQSMGLCLLSSMFFSHLHTNTNQKG